MYPPALAGKPHRVDGINFDLGTGGVIKGWDVGFATMQVRPLPNKRVRAPNPPKGGR